MSSLDEDVARPIYHENNRSFMQFGSVDTAGDSETLENATTIPLFQDPTYSKPDVLDLGPQGLELPLTNSVSESLQDQLEYNKYQVQPADSRETIQQRDTQTSTSFRRDDLSNLLQSVFNLRDADQLISHYPAWLLKSVMLQGHLYIMKHSLCFYAYMPKREDVTVKAGYLTKRSRTTSRLHRYWFILKNNLLSYYDDAADLYFPSGYIDLRQAMTAEADLDSSTSSAFGFQLVTSQQEYHLSTDTASSCNEWIKTLRKVIFRLKNDGDSVKITIPFASILDVEASDVLHFTDTMKIRIADDFDTFAINEYFFSLRSSPSEIISTVKDQVRWTQENFEPQKVTENARIAPPVVDTSRAAPLYYTSVASEDLVAWRARDTSQAENLELLARNAIDQRARSRRSLSAAIPFRKKDTSVSASGTKQEEIETPGRPADTSESVSRTSSMTRLIDSSLKTVGTIATSAYRVPISVLQYPINTFLPNKSSQDAPAMDEAVAASFRSRFGASDDERLLKAYKPFYVQAMPLIGDLYVSDERICFRNLTPGIKKRIAVPLKDIESAQKEKGFSFGFSGLVMTIRAHEDMFFEFSQSSERDQCVDFINGALGNLDALAERRNARREAIELKAEIDQNEHVALEKALGDLGISDVLPNTLSECAIDVPAIMFDSPGASILAFKPAKQLRFTCLTIGSRGDVQPYVALCKGLIADGHKAKIATHEEFREFVQSHGIEFAPVEGNPAELMAICVEHGMFTYSFLKEASQKFRGWIDELLLSSWKACQNTDVLIESPSAMGGIHIAEALGVPYYRAFTMPWSKTRVYPHAFAVPDHSRGGSYNALTYVAFDHLFWKAISGQVNRWRKKTLNIPATDYDKLAQHKVPFLYNFSPSVVPPARDWHEWIRVTGYWFLDGSDDKDGKKWEPPERVVDFITKSRVMGKKLVYIGFGSIVVSDPKALTKAVIDAVYQAGVRCILVKGWSARSSHRPSDTSLAKSGSKSPLKDDQTHEHERVKEHDSSSQANVPGDDGEQNFGDDILSLDSIPHDWLFPQVDAVCHHGGAGSLGASLRAGIPTIVKPFFGDQHFFGGRVQELGVGICLHSLTVNSLCSALNTCTSDRLIIERADKIGQQIRNENGVEIAIENIYRDLEYARSLVKRKGNSSGSVSETSGESYDLVEVGEAHDDEDDTDLFETKIDDNGITSSILKPLKSLKLLNPIGQRTRLRSLSKALR